MKTAIKGFGRLVLWLGVFSVNIALGSWQQLGPQGASIKAMTNVPNYPDELYIAVGSFPTLILHTSNTGNTWVVLETIPDFITALAIAQDARTLYAGGKTKTVYKSTNAGATWQVCATLPEDAWLQQIAVNPENSSEVWAVAEVYYGNSVSLALYYSTNSGSTWTGRKADSASEASARFLTIDPKSPGKAFIGGSVKNRPKVFLTTNYGGTWEDKSLGLQGRCAYGLAISPTDSLRLICATDTGIYYSSNLGNSWTRCLIGPAYSVAFASSPPYYAYAGGENLVYRSSDYGYSWRADTTTFIGTNTRLLAINPNSPLELYAGNSYGIFYTTNGGYNWTYKTPNLKNLDISFINFFPSDTLFAGAWGYGILFTTDAGLNWNRWGKLFPGSGWVKDIARNPRHPDTLVCVTGFDSRLHLTIDQGDSWVTHNIANFFEPNGVLYHPIGPDTLYVWGGKRDSITGPTRLAIFRSTDRGQTWTNLLLREEGTCIGFITSSKAETLIAFGKSGNSPALFRSTDRGTNWTNLTSGIIGAPVTDLKPLPNQNLIWFCTTPSGVFKSENGCLSWISLGLPNATCVLPDTLSSNRLWVGTDTQGVFYTTNNGIFWDRDTLGISGRKVSFLYRHPAKLSAVYVNPLGYSLAGKNCIGIEENHKPETEIYRLSADGSRLIVTPTVITRSAKVLIPQGTTRLLLYDPTGRLLRELPTETSEIGNRNSEFGILIWHRPKELPPGVYILAAQKKREWKITKIVVSY
ncbi:MAG: hypothetical protein ABIK39_01450 [candidate division WOR-3 bacterium]